MKIRDSEFCEETQVWSIQYAGLNNKYPIMDIEERLRIIERRLLIIDPAPEDLAKYPALSEAYKEYKIIERLTIGNDKEA